MNATLAVALRRVMRLLDGRDLVNLDAARRSTEAGRELWTLDAESCQAAADALRLGVAHEKLLDRLSYMAVTGRTRLEELRQAVERELARLGRHAYVGAGWDAPCDLCWEPRSDPIHDEPRAPLARGDQEPQEGETVVA